MATTTSYDITKIKEDVDPIIYLLAPSETPLLTLAKKGKANGTKHEWLEDALAAVAENKNVEGSDASFSAEAQPTNLYNYCQEFRKTAMISDSVEATDMHGRTSEMKRAVAKKMKELKRDIEYAFVGTPASSGTARQTAAVGNASTAATLGGAHSLIHADTTDENSGTPRAFTETIFLSVLQKVYTAGGNPTVALIPTSKATIVAGFAAASGRERDFGGATKLVNAVDLYVSPFGEVKIVIDRYLDSTSVLAIDPEHWAVPHLRTARNIPLAKTGSAEKRLIDCVLTLKHGNKKASGMATDLS